MDEFLHAQRLIATSRSWCDLPTGCGAVAGRGHRRRHRTAMNHSPDVVCWDGPVRWTGQQADSVSLAWTTCVRSIAAVGQSILVIHSDESLSGGQCSVVDRDRQASAHRRTREWPIGSGAGQRLLAYLEFRARPDGRAVRTVGSDRRPIDHSPPKARNLTPRDPPDRPATPVGAGRRRPIKIHRVCKSALSFASSPRLSSRLIYPFSQSTTQRQISTLNGRTADTAVHSINNGDSQ